MELDVQLFIEKHLDLIDTDDWHNLFLEAYNELSNQESMHLIHYLEQAGLNPEDIHKGRSSALIFIIYKAMENLSAGNYGFNYFSNINLKNFLGLSFFQMKKFILENEDKWPDNVAIVEYDKGNYDIVVDDYG